MTIHARSIPESNYAVVEDVERKHIVFSGTIEECRERANTYNHLYQSTAYQVREWINNAN